MALYWSGMSSVHRWLDKQKLGSHVWYDEGQRLSLLLYPTPPHKKVQSLHAKNAHFHPKYKSKFTAIYGKLAPKINDKWPIRHNASNVGIRAVLRTWLVLTGPKQATEIGFSRWKGISTTLVLIQVSHLLRVLVSNLISPSLSGAQTVKILRSASNEI